MAPPRWKRRSDSRARKRERARKVCYFTYIIVGEPAGEKFWDFYVLDLDRNPILDFGRNPSLPDADFKKVSMAPALRVEFQHFMGACVLDSTIYLFSGVDTKYNHEGKSVYSYKLSPPPPPDSVIEQVSLDNMKLCSPMCGKKDTPYAISTPDCQKILVFSTSKDQSFDDCEVSLIDKDPPVGFVDFELYDYVTGTSQELPPIPDSTYSQLVAYYFTDDTTFVVRTDKDTTFTLDISQSPNWKLIRDLPCVNGEGFQVCGGRGFVFTSGFYGMTKDYASAAFPSDPIFKSHCHYLDSVLAAPVDRDKFCCLYNGFDFDPSKRLSVHIIVYQNDPEDPEGRAKRSSQYAFELTSSFAFFHPWALFPALVSRATVK